MGKLDPAEGLGSSLKAVELANLVCPNPREVIDQAHRGVERVRRTPHLTYSFPAAYRPTGSERHLGR